MNRRSRRTWNVQSVHLCLQFAERPKTLRGLTAYEAICKATVEEPDRFKLDPVHLTSGLNT